MPSTNESSDLDNLAPADSLDNSSDASAQNSDENLQQESQQQVQQQKKKPEYDPRRVREFLIKVAKAVIRHEIRNHAHDDFHKQVDKIKDTIASKKGAVDPALQKEIDTLRQKVGYLVKVEKDPNHPENDKYYKEKIAILEAKLDALMKSKEDRENRFKELEQKVDSKYDSERELVKQLEEKLLFLERKLIEHQLSKKKSKQKVNTKAITDIKQQIQSTKDVISQIKK